MAKRYKLKHSNVWVTLHSKPFAGGGEGNLYKIVSPRELRNYVAKVYHPHKLTKIREEKINYLAEYPPEGANGTSVIWVKDALYEGNKFVGFIMPYTEGEKLEILCTPKIPRKLRSTWGRFEFNKSPNAVDLRLKLCFNICAAIHQVHAMERYVLVDMKPDNIVIQTNGLVSIVDTDSVEVVEEGKSLFDAPVATPEYTPPEHYLELDYDPTEREEWDRFGLGVILYKLLFGIHPFAASSGPPYEHLTSLHDKIKHGLFVHHPAKSRAFTMVPPPHKAFYQLDKGLQDLFMRCFIDGHDDPSMRPSAEEWCATLLLALDDEAAYKRYGHILGVGIKTSQPRFSLPSAKIALPNYPQTIQSLVELSKENDKFRPRKYMPAPDQLKTFRVQPLSSRQWIGLIMLLGIVSLITTPFGGMMLAAVLLYRTNKQFKQDPIYRLGEKAKRKQNYLQKSFDQQKRKVARSRRKFKRNVRRIIPKIERFTSKIKQEIEELKAYLEAQDLKVKSLEKKALEQYKLLNQKYVNQAREHRAIARLDDSRSNSLAKLRLAIKNSHKKAVDQVTKENPISEEHPTIKEEKIAIDALVKDKRIKIGNWIGDKTALLYQDQERALDNLYKQVKEDTNLNKHLERLLKGKRRLSEDDLTQLQKTLESLNFSSILQLYSIDTRAGKIVLKDGRSFSIKQFRQYKIVLKNLRHWYDETKHQLASLNKEKIRIKATYEAQRRKLEDEKRIELKNLERFKKGELQKVKIAVQKVVLGAPFSNLQEEYEEVTEYVDALETAYEEEQELVLKDYNEAYEQIILASEAKALEVEAEIKESKEQLDDYTKKINHPKVQKSYAKLKEEVEELRELLPKLEASAVNLKKYKNINFNNYLKAILTRK